MYLSFCLPVFFHYLVSFHVWSLYYWSHDSLWSPWNSRLVSELWMVDMALICFLSLLFFFCFLFYFILVFIFTFLYFGLIQRVKSGHTLIPPSCMIVPNRKIANSNISTYTLAISYLVVSNINSEDIQMGLQEADLMLPAPTLQESFWCFLKSLLLSMQLI